MEPRMIPDPDGPIMDEVKERIVMAAAQVFGEQGYSQGTIRDIAKLADVNVAAINYHFGDKRRLYVYVTRYWRRIAEAKYPLESLYDDSVPARDRLNAFIRLVIEGFLLDPETRWYGRILAWEGTLESTEMLRDLVHDVYEPLVKALNHLIGQLLDQPPDSLRVRYCSLSVMAQCMSVYTDQFHIGHMFGVDNNDPGEIERLIRHIRDFSHEAIMAMKNRRPEKYTPAETHHT